MAKHVCIHGHFYQPPRENPWLEALELQDSAAPYHDWNERISAECYTPNSAARLLDHEGRIKAIQNNFASISFNFGPTLLAWLKDKLPETHAAIIAADKESVVRFGGHGSALAQNYNHIILPLANERDKRTQIVWGIKDFESRFERKPEGMWLAETAADTPTLEALAAHGILFTILSPYQANKVRPVAGGNWHDVNGGRVDPKQPYLIKLPSGKTITVFFYDGPVSQAVAFERLLDSGDKLANRLAGAFDGREEDQLVHIATDGESYGHHHKHGEMALAYAVRRLDDEPLVILTNYGEYLEKHPPTWEAQIHEKSAWSCSHGVGRWMHDCGCNSGGRAGWKQAWRAPLRHALDWLRDELAPLYEQKAREFLKDPWAARDDYIQVILDRSPRSIENFFDRNAGCELSETEQIRALKLLELQRHAMLMYTSCGWFFDELTGIETVQVIQYAARALQLSQELFGIDLEPGFLERLEKARSNLHGFGNGRQVYQRFVKPAMIDWKKIVAHYSISSVFQEYPDTIRMFNYTFHDERQDVYSAGRAKLVIGTTRVRFEITQDTELLSYAALYMGEHHVTGGVYKFPSDGEYRKMAEEVSRAFERGDFPETIRLIYRHLGPEVYSLKSLFKDEQRRVLNDILASTRDDLEGRYRRVVERYLPLMRFLEDVGAPYPAALETAVDFVLGIDLCKELNSGDPAYNNLRNLIQEAEKRPANLLDAEFGLRAQRTIEGLIASFENDLDNFELIRRIHSLVEIVQPLPVEVDLSNLQNSYYRLLLRLAPDYKAKAAKGSAHAKEWLDLFFALGDRLGFAPPLLK